MSFGEINLELLEGLLYTLLIFASTLIIALPLGLLIAMGSKSKIKIISWIVKAFVWVIRGTPLMLQLIAYLFIPSALSDLFGWDFYVRGSMAKLMLVIIAFSVNLH